jgi:hypothetical protein
MEKQESKRRFPTFPQPRRLRTITTYGIRILRARSVRIKRSDPILPTTFAVPAGTVVYIDLWDTRWNEAVTFTLAATKITVPDVAAAAFKNFAPALQTLVIAQPLTQRAALSEKTLREIESPDNIKAFQQNISDRQNEVIADTSKVLQSIQDSNTEMVCLSNYQEFRLMDSVPRPTDLVAPAKKLGCSQANLLTSKTFFKAEDDAISHAKAAAGLPLRLVDIADLTTVVNSFYLTCMAYIPGLPEGDQNTGRAACRGYAQNLSSQQALISSAITDAQKAQDTLLQVVQTLNSFPGTPTAIVFKLTTKKLTNMVVTITGQEIINKVSSSIQQ